MKTTVLILVGMVGMTQAACSSLPRRTRATDPVMRVAIDADSMPQASYARLLYALVQTGKFIVVDRSSGFRAITHEQEIQHTTTRFGANEKYALWAKMYGAGGIFVATEQCSPKLSFLFHTPYGDCTLDLSLLDATTGEVLAASEVQADQEGQQAPDWTDSVDKLMDLYPKKFISKTDAHQTVEYDDYLKTYRDETIPKNGKSDIHMNAEDHISR